MKRRHFIVSAAALASLSGCGVFTGKHTLRYRLTLNVSVNGAQRAASTVLETTWVDTLGLGQGSRWTGKTWGDAILISMEGTSALVGLLGFVPGYEPGFTLPYDWLDFLKPADRSTDERRFESIRNLKGDHSLPPFQWPLLTYIADVRDLATANLISKSTPDGRFSILDCSLAVTSSPISHGIEHSLPCLNQVGTYNPGIVPIEQIPAFQLFRTKNFSANGEGI